MPLLRLRQPACPWSMFRRLSAIWAVGIVPVGLLAWSFLFRFNDPDGSMGGLVDDHFFYLVRGWQMLYGDLPDRDFVDPGAPLTFVFAALTQQWIGPGVWSEMAFCCALLALATALTYLCARRLSGSVVIGILAAVFQAALQPRLYSYAKLAVYAVAVPCLWQFLDSPTRWRRSVLAVVTAVALLLRHDHGVFVGLLTVVAIAMLPSLSWRERARQVVLYGALVVALLSPYLVYLQVNGGVVTHFVTANAWAQHDRERAPLVLPEWERGPLIGDAAKEGPNWWDQGVFREAKRQFVPWTFWFLMALPLLGLATLPLWNDRWPVAWPRARQKVALVVVLGVLVNWGFLRGNLQSRFGDVSVVAGFLLACLLAVGMALARGRTQVGGGSAAVATLVRLVAAALVVTGTAVTCFVLTPSFAHRMESANLTERSEQWWERMALIRERGTTWPLEGWAKAEDEGLLRLAFYLRDCTAPSDRTLVSDYWPQVTALAQRPFAAGHGDLRPGFFDTPADQALTVSRMRAQRVPLVIHPVGERLERFTSEFKDVNAYLNTAYRTVGQFDLGNDIEVTLLASRAIPPVGTWRDTGWPCYR